MIDHFIDFTSGRIAVSSDSCTLQKQLFIPTLILLLHTHNIFQLGLGLVEINIRHFLTGTFYRKSCLVFQPPDVEICEEKTVVLDFMLSFN